jgi:hypothetical protein
VESRVADGLNGTDPAGAATGNASPPKNRPRAPSLAGIIAYQSISIDAGIILAYIYAIGSLIKSERVSISWVISAFILEVNRCAI